MTDLDGLRAELAEAEASMRRVRAENAELAEQFRTEPTEDLRELLKRGALSLASLRDRVEQTQARIDIVEKTGSEPGVVAVGGRVVGRVAVPIPPGVSSRERAALVDDAVGPELARVADELGVTLSTAHEKFTRELPGRDAEGRTLLEVGGRVEGDLLFPALSSGKKAR